MMNTNTKQNEKVNEMFSVGAHFGYDRSRRHPSVIKYIFGRKNNVEIFDLERTAVKLEEAKEFVKKIGASKRQILFVGGKKEAQSIIQDAAMKIDQPYVCGRWIGGTLTNFEEIRKRVKHYLDLSSQKEKGELAKYKKKERLTIEKEIEKLDAKFSGISNMERKPAAVFIIDANKESIARDEAIVNHVPIISLSSSDCHFDKIDYVIPANDSSVQSIKYFTNEIISAYEEGQKEAQNMAQNEAQNKAQKDQTK